MWRRKWFRELENNVADNALVYKLLEFRCIHCIGWVILNVYVYSHPNIYIFNTVSHTKNAVPFWVIKVFCISIDIFHFLNQTVIIHLEKITLYTQWKRWLWSFLFQNLRLSQNAARMHLLCLSWSDQPTRFLPTLQLVYCRCDVQMNFEEFVCVLHA